MKSKMSVEEIHRVEFEILSFFDEICTSQSFTYVLAYGTLLGAVRHKGFIPWDDDIDIWMPRKDYDKFCKYCSENKEKIVPYRLINLENEERASFLISRFSDMSYPLEYDNGNNYASGLFIDIFPLDNMGSCLKEAKQFYKRIYTLKVLHDYARMNHFPHNTTLLKQIATLFLYPMAKLIGDKRIRVKLLNYSKSKKDNHPDNYYGIPIWPSYYLDYEIFEREFLFNRIQLKFESKSFWAPKGYRKLLRTLYGDFMQYPPESEREYKRHGFDAYRVVES